jgi:hypothetical protein
MTKVGPVEMDLAPGWEDVTFDLNQPPPPFTVSRAKGDGAGVFQLSPAVFRRGALPNTTLEHLAGFCADFGKRKNLPPGVSPLSYEDPSRLWYGMTYTISQRLTRVWYASDRKSFVLATFVPIKRGATESDSARGIAECEQMLSSLRFPERAP